MSRVQLALNVADLEASVAFYSSLFGVGPAKREPGYANFAVTDPPLKLVLMEGRDGRDEGVAGALNHLGVEVQTTDEVTRATAGFAASGVATDVQQGTTCCFAVQDKVWVRDPDGSPWEIYTVLDDAPPQSGIAGDGSCCPPAAEVLSVKRSPAADSACC